MTETDIIMNNNKEPIEELARLLSLHLDKTRIWSNGSVYVIKELVHSVCDLKIVVYRDHFPSHFHVLSRQSGIDARFSLDTLDLINEKGGKNKITSGDIKKVKDFFKWNPDMLELLHHKYERLNN